MMPLTLEWIEKAEKDWNSLNREMGVRRSSNYDMVCFCGTQINADFFLSESAKSAFVCVQNTG